MNKGILYISFGKDCDILAANTIAYSRQFTDLPICVLTNIKNRCSKWNEINNITFIEVDAKLNENRDYKTRMYFYTPFDETLYLDCDSVIHNKGVEKLFDMDVDLVLNSLLYWKPADKIINLYKKAMKLTAISLPLRVYNGAFILFNKKLEINKFFKLWNSYWKLTGSGREMPALACALKNSNLNINILKAGIFAPDYYFPNSIVQHNYTPNGNKNFFEKFNIPVIQLSKPFDHQGTQKDWTWVYE